MAAQSGPATSASAMANSRRFITCSRQPDRRLDHSGLRDRCDIGTQRSMRVILEPSRLMLYIRPFSPSTNTITGLRSEEHTSELQSLMRISYAVFCLNKKNTQQTDIHSLIRHIATVELKTT